MQFNPWRTSDILRPLGSLNRARKLVYSASSAHWSGRAEPPGRRGVFLRSYNIALDVAFGIINRFIVWHRLPTWLQLMNLSAIREELRRENLHDTSTPIPVADPRLTPLDPTVIVRRSDDGSGNDLAEPAMGAAGARFGRNLPIDELKHLVAAGSTDPERPRGLLDPNPRLISMKLMKREAFIPASTLNLLAAAWIQFQVHDWFNHGRIQRPAPEDIIKIPAPSGGDDWDSAPMLVVRTPRDTTRSKLDKPLDPLPTFRNVGSHWWDGSQIYGSDLETTRKLRACKGGRLRMGNKGTDGPKQLSDIEDELLPLDEHGMELSGFTDNWWIGLSLIHNLFAREHNAICDRLQRHNSKWDDERLFQTARLINTALLAKIHTVEWTPAILGSPALKIGMNANWWGLTGERFKRSLGRLSNSEVISGIIDSPPEHHTAPFSLTEEFVSVYRMHPLMPDRIPLRRVDGNPTAWINIGDYLGADTRKLCDMGVGSVYIMYSFGMTHPGAITLGNFPEFLRRLKTPSGLIDLAVVDVLRDRERGVPRYNDFRRMIHMPRVSSFDELNSKWASALRKVYRSIDDVDALVGMLGETPPHGFGFSDTAFRIFIVMASRRLKSDRFFTTDYSADIYTQVGLDWIDENDMISVIIRHFPELAPALHGLDNAFVPWKPLEYLRPQSQPLSPEATDAQPVK